MKVQIKCKNRGKIIDIFNILQSHIINSPEDRNPIDCIVYLTKNNSEIIPIYDITIEQFLNDIVIDKVITFNNSTMVIVLEFIEDCTGKQFIRYNDTLQLNYK